MNWMGRRDQGGDRSAEVESEDAAKRILVT